MTDLEGNTALWESIAAKHHSIFKILYHWASISDPFIAGDLLCTAAKRNDVGVMKELLKHGLYVDSKDVHGQTAIQVATTEKHLDIVQLLVMNGSQVDETIMNMIPSVNLSDMLQKREIGHCIVMSDTTGEDDSHKKNKDEERLVLPLRVSIYRGHPANRSTTNHPGKLVRMPSTLDALKTIAGIFNSKKNLLLLLSTNCDLITCLSSGQKFGFDATNALVTNEEGAEIDSIQVIRDNDKLFIVETES